MINLCNLHGLSAGIRVQSSSPHLPILSLPQISMNTIRGVSPGIFSNPIYAVCYILITFFAQICQQPTFHLVIKLTIELYMLYIKLRCSLPFPQCYVLFHCYPSYLTHEIVVGTQRGGSPPNGKFSERDCCSEQYAQRKAEVSYTSDKWLSCH